MTEPANCPFCGHQVTVSNPQVINGRVYGGTVSCANLTDCFNPHIYFDLDGSGGRTLEDAIAFWNRRVQDGV